MRPVTKRRSKSDCKSFFRLFDKPSGKTRTIRQSASTYDTMEYLSKVSEKDLRQVRRYANHLKGMNLKLKELCIAIWNDLFGCIDYELDASGYEQVRSPERLVSDAIGDCDCYTRFLVILFGELGLPIIHRKTDYGAGWQHVYAIVPLKRKEVFDPNDPEREMLKRHEYIVIDPVAKRFDWEKPYSKKFDAMSVLQSLEGFENGRPSTVPKQRRHRSFTDDFNFHCMHSPALLDSLSGDVLGDLGILKKFRKKVGKTIKKVGKVGGKAIRAFNKINPVTILLRNGFLLSMKLNIMQVAKKLRWAYLSDDELRAKGMSQQQIDKIRKGLKKAEGLFRGAGGKTSNLKKAILKGKGNKDRKVSLNGLGSLDRPKNYEDVNEWLIINTPAEELDTLRLIPLEYEREDGTRFLMDGEGNVMEKGSLGAEPVSTGAAVAAAAAAVKAVAEIVKGFKEPNPNAVVETYDEGNVFMENLPMSQSGSFESFSVEEPAPTSNGNKALIIGGVAAVGLLGVYLYTQSQEKAKPKRALSGTKSPKRKRKAKAKPKRKPVRKRRATSGTRAKANSRKRRVRTIVL